MVGSFRGIIAALGSYVCVCADLRVSFLVFRLFAVNLLQVASSDGDHARCEGVVKGWAASVAGSEGKDGDKLSLRDLLFFLHIPRTGGRTYFHWYDGDMHSSLFHRHQRMCAFHSC